MLDELTAKNLGLIEHAEIQLDPGLTVITGETGAGKTLMLGALRLLRGDKAGKSVIGPAAERTEVAARFTEGDAETVLRRSVDGSRSRAYIDDTASTNSGLAAVAAGRIAIVGQHDQLALTTSAGIRSLVDAALDPDGQAALGRYRAAWANLKDVLAEIEEIGGDVRGLEREHDTLTYQIEEIDGAELDATEEDELAARLQRLRNADALGVELDEALVALGEDGADALIGRALDALGRAATLDPSLDDLAAALDRATAQLRETTGSLAVYASEVELDPEQLERMEMRTAEISALKRKYGDSVSDILTFRKDAGEREAAISALLTAAEDIEQRHRAAFEEAVDAGSDVRVARIEAGRAIATKAIDHLVALGFTDPVVIIDVEPTDPASHGSDRLTVRFASSSALEPGPVSSIASGGELSRLVLALTLAAGTMDADVVAFDEIDAGVGGTTALAMGSKLAALSEDRQVICVTHLPQVAAHADAHFRVTRSGDVASVEHLEGEARIDEVTRMLAGLSASDTGKEHARELIDAAGK